MATLVKTARSDQYLDAIKSRLDDYERENPGSQGQLYRQNSGSIRVRVVDDRFAAMNRADRHDLVFDFLQRGLPDDVLQEISVLLPVTKDERAKVWLSIEFDHPTSSGL